MKIGFIGAGKVGFSLGHYFYEKGLEVSDHFHFTLFRMIKVVSSSVLMQIG